MVDPALSPTSLELKTEASGCALRQTGVEEKPANVDAKKRAVCVVCISKCHVKSRRGKGRPRESHVSGCLAESYCLNPTQVSVDVVGELPPGEDFLQLTHPPR
ncbi:hypothetical protein EVAR_43844_1 [Eumeta japonica]|uniref:Uncharacterized protein n=1 Tax=Eumeta variegata TaxID=151549 RepID=A0A4C1WXI7_EUMVA|nr:hypothetical protein EVAR_43844_1 [Eumeta japonica]